MLLVAAEAERPRHGNGRISEACGISDVQQQNGAGKGAAWGSSNRCRFLSPRAKPCTRRLDSRDTKLETSGGRGVRGRGRGGTKGACLQQGILHGVVNLSTRQTLAQQVDEVPAVDLATGAAGGCGGGALYGLERSLCRRQPLLPAMWKHRKSTRSHLLHGGGPQPLYHICSTTGSSGLRVSMRMPMRGSRRTHWRSTSAVCFAQHHTDALNICMTRGHRQVFEETWVSIKIDPGVSRSKETPAESRQTG